MDLRVSKPRWRFSGLTGRTGRAEFLQPRLDGTTRLADCLRDVIVGHVLELRQDSVTSLEQVPQKIGLFHDANLAAVRLLKTAPLVNLAR
jgi:hypothetical protein